MDELISHSHLTKVEAEAGAGIRPGAGAGTGAAAGVGASTGAQVRF